MANSGIAVDLSSLSAQLENLSVHSDHMICRSVLSRALVAQSAGMDLTAMIPKILKLLAHPDLVAKKIVYSLLTEYANKQPDVALLAVNTLTTECTSGNPMVRGLALKTVCSLNHENFFEFGLRALEQGLMDNSAYVRRIAVNCCSRLQHQSPNICQENGLVDRLYGVLRDSDPIVVVNTVVTLEEILKEEGGIVINRSIAHHLLNRLESLTVWGQIYIMTVLLKYEVKSEDETFDVLNILDTYLTHNSPSLVLASLKVFLKLIKDLPHLKEEVIKRGMKGICSVLGSRNHEVVYCVIEIAEEYLSESRNFLITEYKHFFCKHKEPNYLKCKKIQFIPYLVVKQNVSEILDELSLYTADSSKEVSLCSVTAIGTVLSLQPSAVKNCFKKFKKLLETDVGYILSNTLQVLQDIEIRHIGNFKELVTLLSSKVHNLVDDPGKCAFLTIIGRCVDVLPDSLYIIEDFIDAFEEDCSVEVQLSLLSTVTRVFFHSPVACQAILGQMLETCLSSSDKVLKDQAMFYYVLLQTDIQKAKQILTSV